MTYGEAIDWLYSTQLFGIKLGLESPRRLLREYLAFPPHRTEVIHVAGTNGKGSVCALIDSVARATGRRTGLFTSPHLIDYRERILVSGVEISEEDTVRHLTALRALVAEWDPHPTFFELSLALALKYFAERGCELLILETGMGGRLDATSAVPADVAVLTPISLDHQQWLGDTLPEIAAEKAAIIRPHKPVFSSAQDPEARTLIAQIANERRAPLEFVEDPLLGYSIGLPGVHQQHNAALGLAALDASGVQLSYETVKAGLQSIHHPGRFEIIEGPAPVVLDIAHNPSAAAALAATWTRQFKDQRARLVFGAVTSKDLAGILAQLLPLAAEIHLVPVNSPRAVPPGEVRALLPADAPPTRVHPTLQAALASIADSGSGNSPTLITGSAFLVGEAKALLQDEGQDHRASAQ
jgi:dihydrofolate synthase/folylpolyglutamate synthase